MYLHLHKHGAANEVLRGRNFPLYTIIATATAATTTITTTTTTTTTTAHVFTSYHTILRIIEATIKAPTRGEIRVIGRTAEEVRYIIREVEVHFIVMDMGARARVLIRAYRMLLGLGCCYCSYGGAREVLGDGH